MKYIDVRFLVILSLVGAATLLIGWFSGASYALQFLVATLGFWMLYHVVQIRKLCKTLGAPVYGEIPSAIGVWGEVFYRLHRLVKRWHDQVQRVEQQHTRFIQAIQASPNGVLMLDDNNQIEWCNAVAEQHFGLDAKRDIRQQIVHLLRAPEFVQYLHAERYEEPLVLRNIGRKKQSVVSVQLLPYGNNEKLLLSHDITQIENSDAMRRDFVANVSHEMKTPLTVLAGFLETVRDLPLSDEDRARYLDLMHVQSQRMQILIDDLLTLAKLEGNPQPPPDERVSMADMLSELRADAEALSKDRHRIELLDDCSYDVLGAEAELSSAFSNLVSNAVRYTPAGGTIRIAWQKQQGKEGEEGCFIVQDTGLGIDSAHLPRLTERFYRVDRSRSRETGGTGLGLAIVKHVLSRHQFELDISSEIGKGSRFSVRIPASRLVARCRENEGDPATLSAQGRG